MNWTRIFGVARRHVIVLRRVPFRWFDILLWPTVDVILYGSIGVFVTQQTNEANRSSAAYLLCGIMLFHFLYQTQVHNTTAMLEETWSRNLLNLVTTPVTELEYATGIALFGLVKMVAGIGLVTLCGAVMYAFNLFSLGWALVPIALSMMLMGWAISLFVMGLVLRFGQAAEAWTWGVMFIILPLSGAMYPVSSLPAALRPASTVLPTTYAFAAGRAVLDGKAMPWREIAIAWGGGLVLVAMGTWFMARMIATFRRRGLVTRFS